ncbi:hypothetical protein HI113_43535 [Corallococcus exiguus]|nr:hypothetical protein [Corallococcus exiguus]
MRRLEQRICEAYPQVVALFIKPQTSQAYRDRQEKLVASENEATEDDGPRINALK